MRTELSSNTDGPWSQSESSDQQVQRLKARVKQLLIWSCLPAAIGPAGGFLARYSEGFWSGVGQGLRAVAIVAICVIIVKWVLLLGSFARERDSQPVEKHGDSDNATGAPSHN